MPISRDLALLIIKYLLDNPTFAFPFLVVCKNYATHTCLDEDFVEIIPQDDYENLVENAHYDTFELWGNVQKLELETLHLLSKGFIEKMTYHSIENKIQMQALTFRNLWKEELLESTSIEEFAQNEYFGGKAEGFEESLEMINKYMK